MGGMVKLLSQNQANTTNQYQQTGSRHGYGTRALNHDDQKKSERVEDTTAKNSLEVLAFLVDVTLVRALPWQVHCGPPALVEGNQQVGARVPERHRHVRRNHLLFRRLALHAVVASHFPSDAAVVETKNLTKPISGPVRDGQREEHIGKSGTQRGVCQAPGGSCRTTG